VFCFFFLREGFRSRTQCCRVAFDRGPRYSLACCSFLFCDFASLRVNCVRVLMDAVLVLSRTLNSLPLSPSRALPTGERSKLFFVLWGVRGFFPAPVLRFLRPSLNRKIRPVLLNFLLTVAMDSSAGCFASSLLFGTC